MVADQVSAFGHELADFVEELGHDWFPRCGGPSWQEVYRRTVLRQAPRGGPRLSLERGVRSQRAMTLAVAEMYSQGVSTRKVTAIVQELCGLDITSTQVSRAAAELDDQHSSNKPCSRDTSRIAWAKLMARVGEKFPLERSGYGGEIRLIAFITEPGPMRRILTHLGEPLEPSPASGPGGGGISHQTTGSQPGRYSRLQNWSAAGAFRGRPFAGSHSSSWPVR